MHHPISLLTLLFWSLHNILCERREEFLECPMFFARISNSYSAAAVGPCVMVTPEIHVSGPCYRVAQGRAWRFQTAWACQARMKVS